MLSISKATVARILISWLPLVSFSSFEWVRAEEPKRILFNRDIRPILFDNCLACQGPDSNARAADLRLDDRQWAIDSGAIEPGKPDSSTLLQRILSDDPDTVMPPPKSHKTLTDEQKRLLREWIESGAEYQAHWSFIAPAVQRPPVVKDQAWVRNPIDNFVLARLEAEQLGPAPAADLHTLARRAALDITGLPPSSAQLKELLEDKSPDAYEKYVDRLLESKHWGEHRGRYWLDYARYADTHGIHFDNFREMWSYRDWVIGAFNRNLPFDQFVIEQLAGDLLDSPTLDQQIATGFNRCNMTTNEGGIIDEEYAVLYARDRTETTSLVLLGLTAGCAVCHDHKFDPMTQRDFYSLSAFFNNTTQPVRDGNVQNTPPIIQVPMQEDRELVKQLRDQVANLEKQQADLRASARSEFDAWAKSPELVRQLSWSANPNEGLLLNIPLDEGPSDFVHLTTGGMSQRVSVAAEASWAEGWTARQAWVNGTQSALRLNDVGDFDTSDAFSYGAWIYAPANANGAVLARMDESQDFRGWDLWLQNGQVGAHIISAWDKDALKAVSKNKLPENKWVHVFITYDGSAKIEGLKVYVDGAEQGLNIEAKSLKGSIRTKVPFTLGQRNTTSPTSGVRVQDLRVYNRVLSAAELNVMRNNSRMAYLLAKHQPRTDAESTELYDWYLSQHNEKYQTATQQLASAKADLNAAISRGTIAHIMQERANEKPMAYVLFRGDYDKRRDPVPAQTPSFLPPLPENLPKNRLGLAQWFMSAENPLTARVTVNRFWQEVFGSGLVSSSGDFGIAGQLPSHPELLDWLAIEFRNSGWDVKSFFKLMLTSATYRQQALVTQKKLDRDPQNRFLSRGPRYRMDAEMVRDFALSASGLLSEKIGGASVKPYQPEGVWEAVAMIGSNTRDYKADGGEALYRRSMYTFWKRSAPPASMDIFNAPSREVCTIRRERTNTPLQALVTMNDPQFVEAAKKLAESIVNRESLSDDAQRIQAIGESLLARPFNDREVAIVIDSLAKLRGHYRNTPSDAEQLLAVGQTKSSAKDLPELASWTMLVNELLNLDDVLNK